MKPFSRVSIIFLILNLRTSFHSNPIEKQLLFLTRSSCFFVGKDHSEINRIMAACARRLLFTLENETGIW